ncbi:transcriptional regulator CRZ1 [Kluyveromyces marxianus DMKU3-1042]|uniref:Transcriptional regulator CRZ1 n=1 Tax=Kluyveromyces marxianus (strain DMKU3-1042 / BCC 29191 / NBRC 104275) TaxID=1003335 RepID=W0THZ0_KLUMD|nr:transcriptional regulator CRZ1 [Kluyveromyces marxianus DMKU3-1042]BAO42426.1 transcriptional regulator CRZ1 [Kluyveromyces marxianus DMKU3-1042]
MDEYLNMNGSSPADGSFYGLGQGQGVGQDGVVESGQDPGHMDVGFSDFSRDILSGFKGPEDEGSGLQQQQQQQQRPQLSIPHTDPSLLFPELNLANRGAPAGAAGASQQQQQQEHSRSRSRSSSHVTQSYYGNSNSNSNGHGHGYDQLSTANSPYMHPSDALSPGMGYLGLDSDIDELLSVHSDLSDVSKDYEYISTLSELQELTGESFDPLPDFVDSQFAQLQLQLPESSMAQVQSHIQPVQPSPPPQVTPPQIRIEQFEPAGAPPKSGHAGTFDLDLDLGQSPDYQDQSHGLLSVDAAHDQQQQQHHQQHQHQQLPTLQNDHISDSFDRMMLTGHRNSIRNRSHSLSQTQTPSQSQGQSVTKPRSNTRSRSRANSSSTTTVARSPSRSRSRSRNVSSRSLSPDERARSLSSDREHLLKLGGIIPRDSDQNSDQDNSPDNNNGNGNGNGTGTSTGDDSHDNHSSTTLNLIGTTKKKLAQKHPSVYACDICDKKFTRPYNLKSHLRSHTDERPYLCSVCGKAFARMHDKNRHEDLHTGKKRYVCGGTLKNGQPWGCGKKFARSDALGRHFKTELGKRCIMPLFEEAEMEKRAAAGGANDNVS